MLPRAITGDVRADAAAEAAAEAAAIYDGDLRQLFDAFCAARANNYWAFNFDRAWRKYCRGVEQESDLAHLLGRWMNLQGKSVLVIGSYLGSEAIAYARAGARVVGIDLDRDALKLADNLARRHGVRVDFYPRDAVHTGFDAGAFDYVSCAQVLEHLPPGQQPLLLEEIWRLCKPGGIFWLDTPNQWAYKDHHDTGLPLIHWLPRKLKVPLACWLGRAATYPEPAFGNRPVYLHYYLSYFRLCRILRRLGKFEILSRYRGFADADHLAEVRRRQGRAGGLGFAVKNACLRLSLRLWNWNWFSGIRLMVRKAPAVEAARPAATRAA
jgi:2-polyprenyl-3-methyl-5-hydroxy-6-metoxy-1,4-benzoquinol methylase